MDDAPVERVNTWNVRGAWLRQEAGRSDQELRAQRLAIGECDPPDLGIFVPPGAFDGGVEPHVPAHVVLVGHMLGVALQFLARGEQPRPVRVRLEPVGIRGRRDVDGKAGVAVDVPSAAETILAVEDDDVVIAQPVELNRRTDSAETRPHDDHVELPHAHERDTALLARVSVSAVLDSSVLAPPPFNPSVTFEIAELVWPLTDCAAPARRPRAVVSFPPTWPCSSSAAPAVTYGRTAAHMTVGLPQVVVT